MRRATSLLVLALVVLWGTTAFGQSLITDSRHDLRVGHGDGVKVPGLDQICLPCHVPHHAYPDDTATVNKVLWNHQETDTVFTPYTTLVGNIGDVNGTSKLCLSCHDGVTAVDNYGPAGTTAVFTTEFYTLDADLSDDHPIGVQYPPEDPGTGTPLEGYHATPQGEAKIIEGKVECASCHDPHGAGNTLFLRDPILASAICLDCHNK